MKTTPNKYLFLWLVFFVFVNGYSQTADKEITAKIEIEESENIFTITGTAENLTDVYKSLYYKLTVFRKSKKDGNQSSNSQDGLFTLDPNQKKNLSKTQINISNDDQVILLLLIYDDEKVLIGKDRIALGEEESNSKNDKSSLDRPNDGLEMLGIISDETKTKLGKDFYDYFYAFYNKIKINSAKIVTVDEELTHGRTTKIAVRMDNEIINEFISKPDDEFLSYMAEDSANKVFEYLKNIEKQKKLIMRY
jgi:hypothetical protein